MKEVIAPSIEAFHSLIAKDLWPGTLFRGVQDVKEHQLLPSVGRYLNAVGAEPLSKEELLKRERESLRRFETLGSAYLDMPGDELKRMTLAQHHGLPTRLLDWTFSPLVALFFATSGRYDRAAAVYAVRNTDVPWHHLIKPPIPSPFKLDRVYAFHPYHISARITPQASVFTIHPDPTVPFLPGYLYRILIPASAKRAIERHLSWCNIHHHSIFPGLDGLSTYLKGDTFPVPA